MIELKVAGVTMDPSRQPYLRRLQSRKRMPLMKLQREPNNKYDPNAIKVIIGTKHVGYIPATQTYLFNGIKKLEQTILDYSLTGQDTKGILVVVDVNHGFLLDEFI